MKANEVKTFRSPLLALALGRSAIVFVAVLLGVSPPRGTAGLEAQAVRAGPHVISDAEIGGIVLTAVGMSVSSGHLALRRSSSPAVKALAHDLVEDCTVLDLETLELLKKQSIEPVESVASAELERLAKEALTSLVAKEDGDFERGYIAHEIAQRRRFLRMLDNALIPGVGAEVIKELLLHVRSTMTTQLERTEILAASSWPASEGGPIPR